MMRNVAEDMNHATQFITDIEVRRMKEHRAPPPQVLDLGMAPGGFSEQVRKTLSPLAVINGITLPLSLGGHELLLDTSSPRLNVEFVDITMLAAEMGFTNTDIPADHPEKTKFRFNRPFSNHKFDLILCGGQVLRTHQRLEYREKTREARRLCVSQLVFALQRIKSGGTLVVLLNQVGSFRALNVIYAFHKFSASVALFKPDKQHAIRSSFYLVAKGVDPQSEHAVRAVSEWKEDWASLTLHLDLDGPPISDDKVQAILDDFGVTFIEMCEPVWEIQYEAISRKAEKGFKFEFK